MSLIQEFEKEKQEKQTIHEPDTSFQHWYLLPIDQFFDQDLIQESSDIPIYDIYDDKPLNHDELLKFDMDTHTHSVE